MIGIATKRVIAKAGVDGDGRRTAESPEIALLAVGEPRFRQPLFHLLPAEVPVAAAAGEAPDVDDPLEA